MTEIEITYCDKCGDELESSQVGLCDACRPRSFAELSERAKDKARESYTGEGYLDYEWWDSIFDDFIEVCTSLGINLRTRPVKTRNGKTRHDHDIFFSGFCSQGDGACFAGRYYFAWTASIDIREHCDDKELHRIADELTAMQTTQRLLGLEFFTATISTSNHNNLRTEIDDWGIDEIGEPDEERFSDLMHDLADWLYRRLEDEYEYLCSNEVIDEYLNDETFTETGTII